MAKIIGKRKTRLKASQLKARYVSKRARKPYRAWVEKCGSKYCVKVSD
jgi:hypothetical protein